MSLGATAKDLARRCSGRLTATLMAALLTGVPGLASGQEQEDPEDRCAFLCRPELKLEPTVSIENLFGGPRIRDLASDQVTRLGREAVFEIIFALDVPTEVPRLAFTLEAIWTPFASTAENVFTGRTAADLGREEVDDNAVELEAEVNLYLLEADDTGGWMEVHFDVVDKFSPAEDPDAGGLYTHKLNLELDASLAFLRWLPEDHWWSWFRNLEVESSLDYLATGLPRAGDEVPSGEERFLDDASPWSLSLLVILPLAPFNP